MFHNGENQAENKLLLLYLLSEVDGEAYQRQVVDLILDHAVMDYFMVQQLISELKKSELIEEKSPREESKKLVLTPEGKNTLAYFKNRIPKNKLQNFKQLIQDRKQALQENIKVSSKIQKLQDGSYLVKLGVVKNGVEELFLKLHVSNLQKSERIVDRWNKNHYWVSEELYSLLLDN
ncbi:DUF4364 family protein [Isachenkonia alkalipeptolytica]|uniref:DUF4364 family protein n=1 Tax=Isachenkonia alkalipeptolytica TaxID=2565777 RepID=A0AA43XMF3_9CLOT|nr:DUF4364 family protein [Isachenkonia alkalipeptolytica]NBG89493.1 DUF4364 family protein [Isachenkonia alkalipeptolytica]